MRQVLHEFEVGTRGTGVTDLTGDVQTWVRASAIQVGVLTLQVRHTSASLMIQENADPEVMRDLERFFQEIVPYGHAIFRHTAEGPDDMPAHVRSVLTNTTLSLPVENGRATLGTWQAIYLYEHRQHPHQRRIVAHLIGE